MHSAGVTKIRNCSIFFGGCQGDETFDLVSNNLIGVLEEAKDLILKDQLLDEETFNASIKSLYEWTKFTDAA